MNRRDFFGSATKEANHKDFQDFINFLHKQGRPHAEQNQKRKSQFSQIRDLKILALPVFVSNASFKELP